MSDRLLTDAYAVNSPANTMFVSSMTVDTGHVQSAALRPTHLTFEQTSLDLDVEPDITLVDFRVIRIRRSSPREYLLSERDATTDGRSPISPAWFQEKKQQLQAMADLPPNWDSYGARTPSTAALNAAQVLLLWLAVTDVPPPDIFPTAEGGIQFEWHVRGLNAEVGVAPSGDVAQVYYHDLRTAEEWERPVSPARHELRLIRSRLLQQHGERRA